MFNAFIYKKQQIKPETLQEVDTDLSTLIADKELVDTIKRVRDIAKIASDGTYYQILAIENQQAVHYAMSFRCLLYDILTYYRQFKNIAARNQKEKPGNKDEFLSGFKKTDKFTPCRTIVIYYGEKKWDAAKKLSDLMEFASEEDKAAFNDYAYELICINELDITKIKFHDKKTRDFFLYVTAAYKGGEEMPEELKFMDLDVAYIAATITGTFETYGKEIVKGLEQGEETINMCEAVQKTLEKKQEMGIEIGKKEGREEGKYENLCSLIRKKILSPAQAADSVNLSLEEFLKKLKAYNFEL